MPKIQYEEKNFRPDTLALIQQANDIIEEYQAQGFHLTLRQLYYQHVARGYIPNTERSYKNLGNIISDGRRAGLIDWDSIEDRTRHLRQLSHWESPRKMMQDVIPQFHIDLWENQTFRIEVWVEKDALVGIVEDACESLDVPFFACRGYVSDSEMWNAGVRYIHYNNRSQIVHILHLGDHDPSGIDMTRDIKDRLSLFTGGPDRVEVERIALNMEQIEDQKPPPNPAKITDSRFEGYQKIYGNQSWELDALQPQFIKNLIQTKIYEYIDSEVYIEDKAKQELGRSQLTALAAKLKD
jgi:hypothetical protein